MEAKIQRIIHIPRDTYLTFLCRKLQELIQKRCDSCSSQETRLMSDYSLNGSSYTEQDDHIFECLMNRLINLKVEHFHDDKTVPIIMSPDWQGGLMDEEADASFKLHERLREIRENAKCEDDQEGDDDEYI